MTDVKALNLEGPDSTIPEQIKDFKTCALVSLKNIPEFQRSKMEIDIRRLDEEDSRWSYLPTLQLSSRYYVSQDEATISFQVANFRPWEPYFTLEARILITQIVMLKHVQATAQSLKKLADSFLQLIALSQIDTHYKQIAELYQQQLRYVENRQESGMVTPLEVEVAKRTIALVTAERQGNSQKRQALLNGLCIAMNLPDPKIFELDDSLVLKQIIGSEGLMALQDLSPPENPINRQIMIKKQILQGKQILLAYSKFMPDFSFGVRSPDVLNVSVDADKDYFFYIGMDLTLWDGNKRSRDITRQEMLLRQMQYEKKELENNDSVEWLQATQQYSYAKSEYALSQSVENLNRSQLEKKQFDYDSGRIQLPDLLNHQISMHRDKINFVQKELAFNRAGLQLRYLSGQLLKDTINISLIDIPYE
ncbi:MAG: TolC family protein [Pseudomonadota bacterium]